MVVMKKSIQQLAIFVLIDCPVDGTAEGLLGSLQHALERLNILSISRDACKRLVVIGTDGASVING